MFHIKDNGQFLCGKKQNKKEKVAHISLAGAHRSSLTDCCPICREKYYGLNFLNSSNFVNDDQAY